MKLCFIDTETTGLDSKKNGVIQIGGIIIAKGERIIFNITSKPFESDVITEGALKANHMDRKQISMFQEPREAYLDFTSILEDYVDKFNAFDKLFFIAYNANFDWSFLWEWFSKNGDKFFASYFFFPYIDLMTIAAFMDMENRHKYKSMKLGDMCRIYNVEVVEAEQHDAVYDARLVEKLFYKLLERKGGDFNKMVSQSLI